MKKELPALQKSVFADWPLQQLPHLVFPRPLFKSKRDLTIEVPFLPVDQVLPAFHKTIRGRYMRELSGVFSNRRVRNLTLLISHAPGALTARQELAIWKAKGYLGEDLPPSLASLRPRHFGRYTCNYFEELSSNYRLACTSMDKVQPLENIVIRYKCGPLGVARKVPISTRRKPARKWIENTHPNDCL